MPQVTDADREAAGKFLSPSDGDYLELGELFAAHREAAFRTLAPMLEAKDQRIEELEGWKAAEEAHHHLLKQRIATLEAQLAKREPVAWLYERPDGTAARLVNSRRLNFDKCPEGWTETPLYRAPFAEQPSEAMILGVRKAILDAVNRFHKAPALLRKDMKDDILSEATADAIHAMQEARND